MELIDSAMKDYRREELYIKAKKRVNDIRGFYWHLGVYIMVNFLISTLKVVQNLNSGESFSEAFFDIATFAVWMAWGIGLAFHALGVFAENMPSIKRWKENKVKQYMEEEAQLMGKESMGRLNKHQNTDNRFIEEESYLRVKKKVDNLVGFYWHLCAYVLVNVFILLMRYFSTGEDFWDWSTFATAMFWGIGILCHSLCVFAKNMMFTKQWEKRKIREYLEKDEVRWE